MTATNSYVVTAPATPGAKPSAVSTHTTISAARKSARDFSRGRRDLRGCDVRIERESGTLVEYAGLGA
jgi:hypothetical protein